MKPLHRKTGGRLTVFAQQAVVGVATIAILLTGCGSGVSDTALAQAKQEAAQTQAQKDASTTQQDTQKSLAAEVKKLKDDAAAKAAADAAQAAATKAASDAAAQAAASKAASDAAAQAAASKAAADAAAAATRTVCDGIVSASANTTCSFAFNVANTYLQNGGGSATFYVWSPITTRYYQMTCTPGVPTVCRGGNNAVVYIR